MMSRPISSRSLIMQLAVYLLVALITRSTTAFSGARLAVSSLPNQVGSNRQQKLHSARQSHLFLSTSNEDAIDVESEDVEPQIGRWARFRNSSKDGLTFKEKLAKAGFSVMLSYGMVSNFSYGVSMSIAWYIFSKKTGLSPLAPDQWKPFLAVYSAFFVFNNIIRPVRFAISAGISPYFDKMIASIQTRTRLSRAASVGVAVVLVNVLGTFAIMGTGISLASAAAGVAIFPSK